MISKSRGFTLIEVLIALVVIGVGLVGVVQFQGKVLKSATDSELRSIAYSIAESELERVRSFSSKDAFFNITDSTASASVEIGNDIQTFDYTIDVNAFNGANSEADDSLEADKKVVSVRVALPYGGDVNLSTVIALIDPGESGLNDNDDGLSGTQADIQHNPGQAPDVIPIDLGNGSLKETSKPLPEIVQKNNNTYASTEVGFSTVTYDSSTNKEINEDFVTVNCKCELDQDTSSSSGSGQRAAQTYYDEVTKKLAVDYPQTLEFASKATGSVAETGQSFLCDRCCRDHHDSSDTSLPKYRWYWPSGSSAAFASNGDHQHYLVGSDGVEVIADEQGENYLENCRFKRIDGIYRLMQDWKLVDITVMPSNYLADGSQGLTDYTAYVASVAESMLDQSYAANTNLVASSPSVAKPSGRDLVSGAMGSIAVGESVQVLSRSLYVDDLTSSAVASIGVIKTAGGSWLDKIPLYEVNTTKLAEWSSASSAIASVDSDPVVAIDDPENDYYGTYFRGRVTGVANGTTSVSAESFITNTGLVGHVAISETGYTWTDSFYDPLNVINDSISIEVSGSSSNINITGTILCRYNNNSNNPDSACNGSNNINDADDQPQIRAYVDSAYYNCSVAMDSNSSGTFTCTSIPSSGNEYAVVITPASSTSLYFSSLSSEISAANSSYPSTYQVAVSGAAYSLTIPSIDPPPLVGDIKANIYLPQ